jgi:N-acetylmuramic acid 6-phosphate etherase
MMGLDELPTESRGEGAADLDLRSTRELVELMNAHDATVAAAVGAAAEAIASAVDAIVERLDRSGRLVYAGAGTSGALAALDAAECESTFAVPAGQVVALVAGADLPTSSQRDAAEDDPAAGASDVDRLGLGPCDAVVGVSASGRTPYVLGAVEAAADAGALTVAVVSAPGSALAALAEHEIAVVVGAEILAGSTRLKAGTAQKLVLNTLSTVSMIRLGRTYGDLLVGVAGTKEKLRARVRRVVELATGSSAEEAAAAVADAGGDARVAIVSLLSGVDAEAAAARLAAAKGNVRLALLG